MRYIVDNDLHIHSYLSQCSSDPEQNNDFILQYALDNGLSTIALTNHYWDEKVGFASSWYMPQNTPHIKEALPLPKHDGVRFLFGCETDMNRYGLIGISRETMKELDFIIVPTTHLHMGNFTIADEDQDVKGRATAWLQRMKVLLQADLPWHKVGIAHLTCGLIYNTPTNEHLNVLDLIDDEQYAEIFTQVAERGCGVELNFRINHFNETEMLRNLRPFMIAKKCGCKFYFGSDSHHPRDFVGVKDNFERIVDLLDLQECDKFKV